MNAATIFSGEGLQSGLRAAFGIHGLSHESFRGFLVSLLLNVLSLVNLAAVIAVVIAGVFLIAGMGSETSRARAKKILLFTAIGLLVLLFSRVIVGIFTESML